MPCEMPQNILLGSFPTVFHSCLSDPRGCPAGISEGSGCSWPGKGTSTEGLDLVLGVAVAACRWATGLI